MHLAEPAAILACTLKPWPALYFVQHATCVALLPWIVLGWHLATQQPLPALSWHNLKGGSQQPRGSSATAPTFGAHEAGTAPSMTCLAACRRRMPCPVGEEDVPDLVFNSSAPDVSCDELDGLGEARKARVFQGGTYADLHKMLGVKAGSQVSLAALTHASLHKELALTAGSGVCLLARMQQPAACRPVQGKGCKGLGNRPACQCAWLHRQCLSCTWAMGEAGSQVYPFVPATACCMRPVKGTGKKASMSGCTTYKCRCTTSCLPCAAHAVACTVHLPSRTPAASAPCMSTPSLLVTRMHAVRGCRHMVGRWAGNMLLSCGPPAC